MAGRLKVVVCVLCVLGPQVLQGQRFPAPGTRVRIVDPPHTRPVVTGSFVRVEGDSVLVVDNTGALYAVHAGGRRRLEVSLGKRQQVLEGLGIGLLLGVGVGAAVGLASYSPTECSQGSWMCWDFGPGVWAAAYAVRFAVPGMVIGGFFGSIPREQWRRVSATQVMMTPGATPSFRVGVSLGL